MNVKVLIFVQIFVAALFSAFLILKKGKKKKKKTRSKESNLERIAENVHMSI